MLKAKIIVPVVIIILLGAGVYWWVYTQSEGYQAEKFVKNLERQYREDTVGGSTPEETLQLFIEALKAGDTELAARYFVLDDQNQWREDLALLEEKGLLPTVIEDLERAKKYRELEDEAIFTAANEQNEAVANIRMVKAPNGLWKILGL